MTFTHTYLVVDPNMYVEPVFNEHSAFLISNFAADVILSPEKTLVTFSQRVQCVNHQLEDGAPKRGVV